MDGAGAGHLYSTVIGLYTCLSRSLAMTCRRVVVVALKVLGVGPAGASTSADLGGSSKYSSSQMPRRLTTDAHEWINEIPTVPIYYLAKPQLNGVVSAETIRLYETAVIAALGNAR
ncbi:hypothetical protein niasHT_006837 [Heterodera trifolii]|uniref:Uncharacterized protein n=1 Tax=Heterodera trifolii TaxID=157864 RepID=A0ABD2MA70_9BILA